MVTYLDSFFSQYSKTCVEKPLCQETILWLKTTSVCTEESNFDLKPHFVGIIGGLKSQVLLYINVNAWSLITTIVYENRVVILLFWMIFRQPKILIWLWSISDLCCSLCGPLVNMIEARIVIGGPGTERDNNIFIILTCIYFILTS